MPDRRCEPRFTPDEPVPAEVRALDGSTSILRGRATDLSGGGLRIEMDAPTPLRPDQPVSVLIRHLDDEPELLEAEVRSLAEGGRVLHLRTDVLSHLELDELPRTWGVFARQ